MFKFTPMEGKKEIKVLPSGEYNFTVKQAKEKLSKKNNEMLELLLSIKDDTGHETIVYDYLLEAFKYKLKNFCASTGLDEKYKSGELSEEDVINKEGRVKLKIEESDEYGDRNVVEDYVNSEKTTKSDENGFDEELPF